MALCYDKIISLKPLKCSFLTTKVEIFIKNNILNTLKWKKKNIG